MGNKTNITNDTRVIETDEGIVTFGDSRRVDNSIFGSMNNQRELEAFTKTMQSTVKNASNNINGILNEVQKVKEDIAKLDQETQQNAVKASVLYKNMLRDVQSLTTLQARSAEYMKDQSIDGKELAQLYKAILLTMTSLGDEAEVLGNAMKDAAESTKHIKDDTDRAKEHTKALKDNLVSGSQAVKDSKALDTQAIDRAIKRWDTLNEKTKTVGEAVSSGIQSITSAAQHLMDTMNIGKLANGLGRSAQVQLQTQLQQAYGLSRSQFNSFKAGIYGGTSSAYSSQQIQDAMGSLNEIGVSLKDVPKYFDTILKGQVALGMTAQTQTALMELSAKTGRQELTLGTNTFAKYLKSIDNLSRSQLNELVTLNANYQSSAAEYGVNTEAFSQADMALSGALAKATGNTKLSSLYQQVSSSIMSSTDMAADLFGMDSGTYKQYMNSGLTIYDLLSTGNGRLNDYYRRLTNDYENTIRYQDEYTNGIDSSSVQLVNQIVALQREGKLTNSSIAEFKNMTADQLDQAIKDYEGSVPAAEKMANAIINAFDGCADWNVKNGITNWLQLIVTLLGVISTGITVKDAFGKVSDIFGGNLFKTAGTKVAGKAVGKAVGKATVGQVIGGAAGIAGGVYLGVKDAQEMSYGQGLDAGDARGFFLGTGSAQKSTGENAISVLSNAGKYAAIGAGIGTIFPVIGTAVGGVVGGAIGLMTGLIGSSLDDQKKIQEDQLNQQKAINKNTYASANALQSNAQSRTMVSVIPFATGGDAVGGDYEDAMSDHKVFNNHPKSFGGYSVTSWYGYRDALYNKKGEQISNAGLHSGIDLGVPLRTPLHAPYDGTVITNKFLGAAGNRLDILDGNNMVHTFMHMDQPAVVPEGTAVKAGQFVGYSGKSGGNYGPHLHYSVSKGSYSHKNTIDPWNYLVNSSIFNSSGVPTYYMDSTSETFSGSSDYSTDKTAELISMNAIGGDNGSSSVVNSINDLKQTIIDLSNRTTANEKLMRSITGTYMKDPRTA